MPLRQGRVQARQLARAPVQRLDTARTSIQTADNRCEILIWYRVQLTLCALTLKVTHLLGTCSWAQPRMVPGGRDASRRATNVLGGGRACGEACPPVAGGMCAHSSCTYEQRLWYVRHMSRMPNGKPSSLWNRRSWA